MKCALSGALLLFLIATQASAQVDCAAAQTTTGPELPGYASVCLATPPTARETHRPATHAFKLDEGATAYALQLTTLGEPVEQGLYEFSLPDFTGATLREGPDEEWSTAFMRNIDFNPAVSRAYVIQTGVTGSVLNSLDPTTLELRAIGGIVGPDPSRDDLTGFTIDPRTGLGWITTNRRHTNNPPLSETWLWRFDTGTATAAYVGRLLPDEPDTVFIDIAMDCSGRLYGHNISDDSLYRINPNDVTVEHLGSHGLPANFAQGMDFDNRDNRLYAWVYTGSGSNQFGTFDLDSGAFDSLAQDTPRGEWTGATATRCPGLVNDPTSFTGVWYDPVTSGQGFMMQYFPDSRTVFMPWFTFTPAAEDDDDGDDDDTGGGDEEEEETPDPAIPLRWFVLQGDWPEGSERVVLSIISVTGGQFDDPAAVQRTVVGEASLSFVSCGTGLLEYAFNAGENAGLSGVINLTRSLQRSTPCRDQNGVMQPAEVTLDPAFSGTWYDPGSSGQGLEIVRVAPIPAEDEDEADEPGFLFAGWFAFDPEPESAVVEETQHWFTLNGHAPVLDDDDEDTGAVKTSIWLSVGGAFDDTQAFPARAVGTAILTPVACDRINLAYEFNDNEAARAFQGLEGSIELHRIGDCPTASD